MSMAEIGEGNGVNIEPNEDISNNSPTQRSRGRPQGSKKLKVCVTDIKLMELVSGISNGGATEPQKKRQRPKHKGQQITGDEDSVQSLRNQGSPKGSKKLGSDESIPMAEHSPKKRGRPKKSFGKAASEDLPNGASDTTKLSRGRPKGSESLTSGEENKVSSVTPRKRGRPKGSLNKTPKLENELTSEWAAEAIRSLNSQKRGRVRPRQMEVRNIGDSTQDTSNNISSMPRRGRGRPRKIEQSGGDKQEIDGDGSQAAKRGRGRPKGSLNKKHAKVDQLWTVYVPSAKRKRGRPKKQPAKRGRPRKYPLPSPEELKKPKVWKPLGRPRKYPQVEPPEGVPPAPRRSRGRPRKSESKKGAHLRKSLPATPSSPHNPNDRSPRKRCRPPIGDESEQSTSRKRGRPKGSVNKSKVGGEYGTPTKRSKSDPSDLEQEVAPADQTHDTDINRDAYFDVSSQA